MTTFEEKVKNLGRRAGDKPLELVKLEGWSEDKRGTPNQILRGALFSAIKGSNRRPLQRELLASQSGYEIRFTGVQLGQNDLDVFELALHLSKKNPLGVPINFTEYSFLKDLGRTTGGKDVEQLRKEFARLGCHIEVRDARRKVTYGGSLIDYIRDDKTGQMHLEINPKIKRLFDAGWTAVDFEQRQSLKSKPLAQWLHAFISTHDSVLPMKVETYHKLCGSNTKLLKVYKQSLKKALIYLQDVGIIVTFRFEGDLVHIDNKTPKRLKGPL